MARPDAARLHRADQIQIAGAQPIEFQRYTLDALPAFLPRYRNARNREHSTSSPVSRIQRALAGNLWMRL
jgi:hypothetical protein